MSKKETKEVEEKEEPLEFTPERAEEIATHITKVSRAMSAIDSSRLTRECIVILLQSLTKLPQRDINFVLNGLGRLESAFLKKAKK